MNDRITMVGEATLRVGSPGTAEPTPGEEVPAGMVSASVVADLPKKVPERPQRLYWFQANKPGSPGIRTAKLGRNQPCPCKSGKKYKKCCGSR